MERERDRNVMMMEEKGRYVLEEVKEMCESEEEVLSGGECDSSGGGRCA